MDFRRHRSNCLLSILIEESNGLDRCDIWDKVSNSLKYYDVIAVARAGSEPGDCTEFSIVASSATNHRLSSFARGGTDLV